METTAPPQNSEKFTRRKFLKGATGTIVKSMAIGALGGSAIDVAALKAVDNIDWLGKLFRRGKQKDALSAPGKSTQTNSNKNPHGNEPTPTGTSFEQHMAHVLEAGHIDGLDTFGHNAPLTLEQLVYLEIKLNETKREMKDDTYYGTVFITKLAYDIFQNTHDETLQHFLIRQVDVYNKLLLESEKRYSIKAPKLQLRRLVVTEDDVEPPNSALLNNEMQDTDGVWALSKTVSPKNPLDTQKYIPESSALFDKKDKLDLGLLHEWGHIFLHLGDQYHLKSEYDAALSFPPAIQGIPNSWKKYEARSTYGNDIMIEQAPFINEYTVHELSRRITNKTTHDKSTWVELAGMSADVPEVTTLHFGEAWKDANVEVFRRARVKGSPKDTYTLNPLTTIVTDTNGAIKVKKEQLFSTIKGANLSPVGGEVIPFDESLLFIKVTQPDGTIGFRWLDVRPFNMACWQGNTKEADMYFRLAGKGDSPETFDWKILYYRPTNEHWQDPSTDPLVVPEIHFLRNRIDDVEVFGHGSPVKAQEMSKLFDQLNREETITDPHTYYATIFIDSEAYKKFDDPRAIESFSAYVKKHLVQGINYPLSKLDNPSQVDVRRIIVVENKANVPGSITLFNELKDSDGGVYIPENFDFSTKDTNLNPRFVQMLGNSVLHLPIPTDVIRFEGSDVLPAECSSIPDYYKTYHVPYYSNESDFMTGSPGDPVSEFTNLQLLRRIRRGTVHTNISNQFESGGYPVEYPQRIKFNFGKEYTGGKVEVYRSVARRGTNVEPIELYKRATAVSDADGMFSILGDDILSTDKKVVGRDGGIFLLKVTDTAGKEAYRWLDIRHFNLAYGKGGIVDARMDLTLTRSEKN